MANLNVPDEQQTVPSGAENNDDGIIVPGSVPPLGSERTDVNPSDEAGVDELPHNEGEIPLDTDDNAAQHAELPDVDVDNAERDDAPNPR